MGFFDDISSAVSSAVSTVSNTVNSTLAGVQDAAGRSDPGKAVQNVFLNPVNAIGGAVTDVASGNFDRAGRRVGGAFLGNNYLVQAGQASSSVNDLYIQGGDYTGGYSRDVSNVSEISTRYETGGETNSRDAGYLTSYGVKTGAMAGALYGGAQLYDGGALSAYETAAAHPGTALGVASALYSGNLRGAANAAGAPGFLANILPDGTKAPTDSTPYPNTSDPMRMGGLNAKSAGVSTAVFAVLAVGIYFYSRKK